ncbi:MAG: hypothetical protein H0T79_12005 [Deltaproteobacteria bacterium]|nr:hypothetical protein [Deltaproteobacteria bacterium]
MTITSALLLSLMSSACVARGGFQVGSSSTAGAAVASAPAGDPDGAYAGPSEVTGSGTSADAPVTGPAEPSWDDFAFAVRERTGTYYGPWIISKLTTFKVGKACWAKMSSADAAPVNTAGYYIRNVHELAKLTTGEDWDRIENQHGDRAKDRRLVEPLMDRFASQFHMTIAVEGDDCSVERDALWISYWYQIAETFAAYPPLSGKLFVTLNVTNTRDVTVEVDDTGSHFTITAPRDIEAKGWHEKMEKPFRKVARKL